FPPLHFPSIPAAANGVAICPRRGGLTGDHRRGPAIRHRQTGDESLVSTLVRHALIGGRLRHTNCAGTFGTFGCEHNDGVHARAQQRSLPGAESAGSTGRQRPGFTGHDGPRGLRASLQPPATYHGSFTERGAATSRNATTTCAQYCWFELPRIDCNGCKIVSATLVKPITSSAPQNHKPLPMPAAR